MIGPKHTFESVVRELREGLENGTIVLDRPSAEATETPWHLSKDRLKTFVASEVEMAYESGLADGESKVRFYTFTAAKKTGILAKGTQHLHLSIAVLGNEVKYLGGDVSEIDKFEIPPEIRRTIDSSLVARDFALVWAHLTSVLIDTLFLCVWAGANLGASELFKSLHLTGIEASISMVMLGLFGLSTITPICIFIYRDIRIMWATARRKITEQSDPATFNKA